jgi:hypothetical protein
VPEIFDKLKGLIDELEIHQQAVADAPTMLGYCRDQAVSKFLFDPSHTLQSQVWGQILGGDSIPSLTAHSPELCMYLLELLLHHQHHLLC